MTDVTRDDIAWVYRRYGASIHRRCRRILFDDALAKDALQETFVRLLRYRVDLEEHPAPLAYLNRVADRICFDLLKKRKGSVDVIDRQELVDDGPFRDRVADLEVVRLFLASIKKRHQEIAVLYFVDELSQVEIAEQLDCTRRTVYSALEEIKRRAEALGRTLRSLI